LKVSVPPFPNNYQKASNLNQGKIEHAHEMKSLNNLFKIELQGALSIVIETINKYFTDIIPRLSNKLDINSPKDLCKKIENDILEDKITQYLPDIYINTCIHTLMRWDKTRQFKANDFYDFEHARAALPYFQYFFTERPLKHILSMKPYELFKKYGCIVEHDIKIINELLTKIAG